MQDSFPRSNDELRALLDIVIALEKKVIADERKRAGLEGEQEAGFNEEGFAFADSKVKHEHTGAFLRAAIHLATLHVGWYFRHILLTQSTRVADAANNLLSAEGVPDEFLLPRVYDFSPSAMWQAKVDMYKITLWK